MAFFIPETESFKKCKINCVLVYCRTQCHIFLKSHRSMKIVGNKERKKSLTCYGLLVSPQSASGFNIQVMASQQGLAHSFKAHTQCKSGFKYFFSCRLCAHNSGTR